MKKNDLCAVVGEFHTSISKLEKIKMLTIDVLLKSAKPLIVKLEI